MRVGNWLTGKKENAEVDKGMKVVIMEVVGRQVGDCLQRKARARGSDK